MATIDNSHWPLNSILVSQKYRLLYMPVAKNANTTLKRLFVRISGYPKSREVLAGPIHTYLTSNRTGLSLGDYTPEDAAGILDNPDYFRFIMLRDPLARAVSGYIDKFVLHPPTPGKYGEPPNIIAAIDWTCAQRGDQPDYGRSITFNEFADYLANNRDRDLDTHFKSQASYFAQQKFDFIGAIERMETLIRVLASRTGRNIGNQVEHRNRIVSKKPLIRRRRQGDLLPAQLRAQRSLPHSSELLTSGIVDQLNNRYARDLELWQECLA